MRDPLIWVVLASLAVGATIALCLRRGQTPQRREINKRKRALWVPILLNVAAASILLGLTFTQGQGLTLALGFAAISVVVVSTAALRFPRAVGLPIVGVLALAAAATVWSLGDFTSLPRNAALAEVRVVAESKTDRRIETRFLIPRQVTHFEIETYPARRWPFSELSVVQFPTDTLLSGLTLWEPANVERRLESPDIVWYVLERIGWAKNVEVPAPNAAKLNYLYVLQTVDGRFTWTLQAPRTRLE